MRNGSTTKTKVAIAGLGAIGTEVAKDQADQRGRDHGAEFDNADAFQNLGQLSPFPVWSITSAYRR